MTRYLPDDRMVCSAYWYASQAGMIAGNPPPGEADLEFLRELGLRAARLARWEGLPAVTAPEGPFSAVYLWPERIFAEVLSTMTVSQPVPVPRGDPEHPHGYWEAGDYG